MEITGKLGMPHQGEVQIGSSDNNRVCAVIVTFNRLDRLQRCLAAIRAQTRRPDTVLVVDNHSSDGTPDYLESLISADTSVCPLTMSENVGPAGGFAAGMTWAMKQAGYGYLWLMDDDIAPEPSCLEAQLRTLGKSQRTIVFPQRANLYQEGQIPSINLNGWMGVLIPIDIVHKYGVPIPELFFGSEDTEYLIWRLCRINGVKRVHAVGTTVLRDYHHSKSEAGWRYYYKIRNRIYYKTRIDGLFFNVTGMKNLIIFTTRIWMVAMLRAEHKFETARFLLLGMYHGFRGQIGKTIDPEQN